MNALALEAAMAGAMDEIGRARRALLGEFSILPDAASEAVRLSYVAESTLEWLRPYVLTDGGPHGSPAAAWEAWKNLAVDTAENLNRALRYADRCDLSSWLQRGAEALTEAAGNVVKGTGAGLSLVALVLGLLVVLQVTGGRRA